MLLRLRWGCKTWSTNESTRSFSSLLKVFTINNIIYDRLDFALRYCVISACFTVGMLIKCWTINCWFYMWISCVKTCNRKAYSFNKLIDFVFVTSFILVYIYPIWTLITHFNIQWDIDIVRVSRYKSLNLI